jgi:hypothetical protein
MATLTDLLRGTFGVKTISPTDPGIVKLADIRTGTYQNIGPVTITPESQAAQLLGLAKDPLAALARSGALDKSSQFLDRTLPGLLLGLSGAVAGFGIGGALGTGVSAGIKGASQFTAPTGGSMSFADGDSGFQLPSFGEVFQGSFGRDLLGIGTQALSGFVSQQFAPQPVSFGLPATMAAVPAIARAGAVVGRGFFNRFPSLATGIQALRNKGANVTRSSLYSMMKRFGPDFLIGGGILTAAAVSELAMAGPGRRRMDPGNVKALRRAHRRMKSFHNVCMANDRLLGGRRSSKRKGAFGGATSVVNVK